MSSRRLRIIAIVWGVALLLALTDLGVMLGLVFALALAVVGGGIAGLAQLLLDLLQIDLSGLPVGPIVMWSLISLWLALLARQLLRAQAAWRTNDTDAARKTLAGALHIGCTPVLVALSARSLELAWP